jgi:hypothetical protein
MAIDNTPPRLKLIVTIATIAVVTLVSLNFVLTSYYAIMTDEAKREKLAPTTELDAEKKAEHEALAAAKIDQAMADLAKGVRPASIAPEQSQDLGPMTGWTKLPKPAPTVETRPSSINTPELVHDAGAEMAADAGATMATDAGVAMHVEHADAGGKPHPMATDAGAPKSPAPHDH